MTTTSDDAPRAGGETPDILAELDRYLDAYRDAIIAEQYAGPELDVEACVRLLKRIASQLRADGALGMSADGDRLDALASALPGMGKDSDEFREACRAGGIACAGEWEAARTEGRLDDARRWGRFAEILHARVGPNR